MNGSKTKVSRFSYEEYRAFSDDCARQKSCSGKDQSPEHIEATLLNSHRMKRLDRQFEPDAETVALLKQSAPKWKWLVLAETWCGDGAQNIPLIAGLSKVSPGIELSILLRDENPEIMDRYLTGGSRSIPKLICYDAGSGEEIGTWGPRPEGIEAAAKKMKTEQPAIPREEFLKQLHLLYASDRGRAFLSDMKKLLPLWIARSAGNISR